MPITPFHPIRVAVAARSATHTNVPGHLLHASWLPSDWALFTRRRGAVLDPLAPHRATLTDALGEAWVLTCSIGLLGAARVAWFDAARGQEQGR